MTLNEVISKVREFLRQNRASDALTLMGRYGPKSPLIENACGVCHLRVGNYDRALTIFRSIAFPNSSPCMDHQTPVSFQTNFVVTMLLLGNTSAGLAILKQIPDAQHPAVTRLWKAVRQWKARQGKLESILSAMGLHSGASFTMESPGDLEG